MTQVSEDLDLMVSTIHRDGYVTIPEAVDSDQVAWARRELEGILEVDPDRGATTSRGG